VFLLDADQDVPEAIDTVRYKWRFYYEDYYNPAVAAKVPLPGSAVAVANQTELFHLEWALNGCDSGGSVGNPMNCVHIEYDVVPPTQDTIEENTHVITSAWTVQDMMVDNCDTALDAGCADSARVDPAAGIQLIMAGGHCHAPSCLSLSLTNADTNELLCT
jgi:hypothetical protein